MGLWALIMAAIVIVGSIISGGDGSDFGTFLISIGGELICDYYNSLDSFLGSICEQIISIIIETAQGTIEVHRIDGQWVTLTSIPKQFDLLQFPSQSQVMISKNIPPGKYDKIRIDLERIRIVTKDKIYTAAIPNKELIIDANIIVDKNGQSVMELNLDVTKSIYRTVDNELIFSPVIDVKSKRNAGIEFLDLSKKLIKVKGGTLIESKNVGMNLDGKMKKDFVLDKNLRLSVENGKIVVKPTLLEEQPKSKLPVSQPLTEKTKIVIAKSDQPEGIQSSSSAPVEEKIGSAIEEVTVLSIQAKKWLFQPNKILVKKGKVIHLNIIPALGLQFTFAIPEYGIEQEITGQTAIKFKADKVGTFKFLCSSCEGFRNMKGTVVVEDTATETATNDKTGTNTVEITASGFVPQIITITTGDTVTWANENIADAWPASAVHPTHQAYPGSNINKCGTIEQATIFDACDRLHQGESWSFIFNEIGTWKYHDHLNPGHTGTVVVN